MEIKINQPYALNEIGDRDNNEDCIFPQKGEASTNSRLFIVCDGVGGNYGGEIASETVCKGFELFLKDIHSNFDGQVFQRALDYVYEQLNEVDHDKTKRMATTLTFLCIHKKGVFMAHIGDSRIYQFRKENGSAKILYKSQDHSLVNDLLLSNIITEEEAKIHPRKNIITRAIQSNQKKRNKAEIFETNDIKPGDYFFMCTDGILEQINDPKLIGIIADSTPDDKKIETIFSLCQGYSKDNFSAYLIPIESVNDHNITKGSIIECDNLNKDVDFFEKKKNEYNYLLLFIIILFILLGVGYWYYIS